MHSSFNGKLINTKYDGFERSISLISVLEFFSEFRQLLGISALIGAVKRKRTRKQRKTKVKTMECMQPISVFYYS